MKTINKHVSIAVLAAALVSFAAFGEETYPTIAEIDAEIASLANQYGARTLWREFEATPTNNVEIAIGCDADEDGLLSLDEAALTVGYDCGEWFVRSAANDSVTYCDAVDSGTFRRTYEVRSRYIDSAWNLVKVTRRGLGISTENLSFSLVEFGFGLTIR